MNKKIRYPFILLALLISFSILIIGCTSSKSSTQSSQDSTAKKTVTEKDSLSVGNAANTTNNSKQKDNSKIIKTANVELETKNYEKTVSSILKSVEDKNGYIQSSKSFNNSDDNSRTASYTIRIPKDYFNDFLLNVGNLGKVTSCSTTGENISSQYYDTEAHITALKVQEQRLLELLKQSGSLKDMLDIENQLSNVRYQIESLTSTMKNWDNQVDYATVTINITEVKELTTKSTSYGSKIGKTFSTSIKSIGTLFKIIFIVIVAVFPYLVIIVPIFIIVHIIKKKRKNKN